MIHYALTPSCSQSAYRGDASRRSPLGTMLVACFAIAFGALAWRQAAAIDFNPEVPVGPIVAQWGWDLKGSLGLADTVAKAQTQYGSTPANLVRIPFFTAAHYSNGTVDVAPYGSMFTSLANIKAQNPNVKVFASIKLVGGDSFLGPATEPNWITQGTTQWPASTGSIFGNPAPRPNPEFYAKMVADYLDFLKSRGVSVNYIGLNNETDGALGVSRYVDTVDRLNALLTDRGYDVNSIQFVAPDAYAPSTTVSILDSLGTMGRLDTVDVVGSHQYPATAGHTSDKWAAMEAESAGKPMWHTEVHMDPSSNGNGGTAAENITRMRRAMGVMFSANLEGAESFIWWQPGSSSTEIDDTLKREITKSTLNAIPVQSPIFDEQDPDPNAPLYQAYRKGDLLTIWVAHPEFAAVASLPVNFTDGFIATEGSLTTTSAYWQGGAGAGTFGNTISAANTGSLSIAVSGNKRGFTIDNLPQNSVAKISLVMTGALVWNQTAGNFGSGFARSNGALAVGATGLGPFGYGGTENIYIGNSAAAVFDATTSAVAGSRVESLRLGTDQAAVRIANRNGNGTLTVNDAVSLTVGNGTAQTGEVGDVTIGEGGFAGMLNWNSTGTLAAEGKFHVGAGGSGTVVQNNGTIIAGGTGGANKSLLIGSGAGSQGVYLLNRGSLLPGGGTTGAQSRELRIGSSTTGSVVIGDGSGAAGSAYLGTRDDVFVGLAGGHGFLAVNADGQVVLAGSSAELFLAQGGSAGQVVQSGGLVSVDHHVRLGSAVGSTALYALTSGTLRVGVNGIGELRIAEAGSSGTLRVGGDAVVIADEQLTIGYTDNSGSVGRLEIQGSQATVSVGNLDNSSGVSETIAWQADSLGVAPLIVRGDSGVGNWVELQNAGERAATVAGVGDGIALDLDLAALHAGGQLLLIDNRSPESIRGYFENPSFANDLFLEGEVVPGTGFDGKVTITYVGGTGNDVMLNLIASSADYDGNGSVDGADLLAWQRGNGSAGGPVAGDANYDGLVNADDLTVWRTQFGGMTTLAAVIPEPASLSIATIPVGYFVRRRLSHRRTAPGAGATRIP